MPESTLDLLEYLYVQRERFSPVREQMKRYAEDFGEQISLSNSLLSYSIESSAGAGREQLFLWQCNIDDFSALPRIHGIHQDLLELAKLQVHPETYKAHRKAAASNTDVLRFNTVSEGHVFTGDVITNVRVAEEVASQTYLCNMGDDYTPGYFSEISIDSHGIHLWQINRANSRSIDHKHNYILRELKFFIPTAVVVPKQPWGSETIGDMMVQFYDHSSENNRSCGDRIRQKMDEIRVRQAGS